VEKTSDKSGCHFAATSMAAERTKRQRPAVLTARLFWSEPSRVRLLPVDLPWEDFVFATLMNQVGNERPVLGEAAAQTQAVSLRKPQRYYTANAFGREGKPVWRNPVPTPSHACQCDSLF
jgi:hypothetical protein